MTLAIASNALQLRWSHELLVNSFFEDFSSNCAGACEGNDQDRESVLHGDVFDKMLDIESRNCLFEKGCRVSRSVSRNESAGADTFIVGRAKLHRINAAVLEQEKSDPILLPCINMKSEAPERGQHRNGDRFSLGT